VDRYMVKLESPAFLPSIKQCSHAYFRYDWTVENNFAKCSTLIQDRCPADLSYCLTDIIDRRQVVCRISSSCRYRNAPLDEVIMSNTPSNSMILAHPLLQVRNFVVQIPSFVHQSSSLLLQSSHQRAAQTAFILLTRLYVLLRAFLSPLSLRRSRVHLLNIFLSRLFLHISILR
jgi:hypothetical protein